MRGMGMDSENRQQIELEVGGMSCDSCATHVTKALREVEGILLKLVADRGSDRLLGAHILAAEGV